MAFLNGLSTKYKAHIDGGYSTLAHEEIYGDEKKSLSCKARYLAVSALKTLKHLTVQIEILNNS